MPRVNVDKKVISDKIALMLRSGKIDTPFLESLTIKELIEEVNIFQQELVYQNDELMNRSLELESLKKEYQALYDDAPIGYVVLDGDLVIRSTNRAFSTLIGAKEPLKGKPLGSLIHPDSQDDFYFGMRKLAQEGLSEVSQLRLLAGPIVHFSSNSCKRENEHLYRCAFIDISQRVEMEQALKAKIEQFDLAINGSNDGIWDWRLVTNELYLSPQWKRQLGYQDNELKNEFTTFENLIHPEDRDRVMQHVNRYFHGEITFYDFEFRMLHKDGHYRWIRARGEALRDGDGNAYRMAGSHTDITERKNMLEALKDSEEKIRMIMENVSDVIWVVNLTQGKFTYMSPTIEKHRGFTVEEALAQSLAEAICPESLDSVLAHMEDAKQQFLEDPESPHTYYNEILQPTKSGEKIWVEYSAKCRLNSQNEIEAVGVSRNIERRKQAEMEVVYLSTHDQLTGIYNRHYFDQKLKEEMARMDRYAQPLSLILMDLDYFKQINDTWGHPVGDLVLKEAVRLAGNGLRPSDILCRIGGEEFAIILPHTTREGAFLTAEKIRRVLENNSHPIVGRYTASLGVAERFPSESYVNWYKRLDKALYRAKGAGRNLTMVADDEEISLTESLQLKWQKDWESGDADLDREHQELLELTNELYNLSRNQAPLDQVLSHVDQVISTLICHMESEDYLLQVVAYPDFSNHSRIHKQVVDKAKKYYELLRIGRLTPLEYYSFLAEEFFVGHLLVEDLPFYPYLKGHAACLP